MAVYFVEMRDEEREQRLEFTSFSEAWKVFKGACLMVPRNPTLRVEFMDANRKVFFQRAGATSREA